MGKPIAATCQVSTAAGELPLAPCAPLLRAGVGSACLKLQQLPGN